MGVLGSGGEVLLPGGRSISTACWKGSVHGRSQNYIGDESSLVKIEIKSFTLEGSFISIQAPSVIGNMMGKGEITKQVKMDEQRTHRYLNQYRDCKTVQIHLTSN